jgi:hypothetical protein
VVIRVAVSEAAPEAVAEVLGVPAVQVVEPVVPVAPPVVEPLATLVVAPPLVAGPELPVVGAEPELPALVAVVAVVFLVVRPPRSNSIRLMLRRRFRVRNRA